MDCKPLLKSSIFFKQTAKETCTERILVSVCLDRWIDTNKSSIKIENFTIPLPAYSVAIAVERVKYLYISNSTVPLAVTAITKIRNCENTLRGRQWLAALYNFDMPTELCKTVIALCLEQSHSNYIVRNLTSNAFKIVIVS